MSNSFDDILKKGKSAAVEKPDDKKKWNRAISNILNELESLNSMYGDDKKHHVLVELGKCDKCGKATFVITVKNLNDRKKGTRFHRSDWASVGTNKYLCDKCK